MISGLLSYKLVLPHTLRCFLLSVPLVSLSLWVLSTLQDGCRSSFNVHHAPDNGSWSCLCAFPTQ